MMKFSHSPAITLLLAFLLIGPLSAQIDVQGKIKSKILQRADQHVDEGIDAGLDAAEDGIESAVTEDGDKSNEEQESKDSKESDSNKPANKSTSGDSQEARSSESQQQPSLTSYSKFDFIPGEKVIYYEDFSQDALSDFPALWNTNASGEVVNTNLYPGNWFRMKPLGIFMPEITIPFNENFTFECDLILKDESGSAWNEVFHMVFLAASPEWNIGDQVENGFSITISDGRVFARSRKGNEEIFKSAEQEHNQFIDGKINTRLKISVWVQKQRLRLYINESKVLDLPRLLAPGVTCNKMEFETEEGGGFNTLMTNVRVAIGAPDTRNKLMTEGKLVTHGILFDVNSDKIKPESFGTLKDIAAVLAENAGIKVRIIGYTDSDGDDAKNLDLSKRRAASVKSELSTTFAIDASRIETDGKGETQPLAPNDTPSNKSQNRRVEFIKL